MMKEEDKKNLRAKLTDLRRDIQKLEEDSLNTMPSSPKDNIDPRQFDADSRVRVEAYRHSQKLRTLSDNAVQMLLNVSEL